MIIDDTTQGVIVKAQGASGRGPRIACPGGAAVRFPLARRDFLVGAEPALVLAEGSIVLNDRDAGGLGLGGGLSVFNAVLHPDVPGPHLDGLVHHRGHQF